MANNSTLKSTITNVVKTNGNGEINGQNMQGVLLAMVNVLGAGYMYLGGATPSTDPGTPDNKVFYLAIEAGTYSNFTGDVITEPTIFYYDTTWHALSTNGNFAAVVRVTDIVNALNSTATDKALSAAKGKALNDALTTLASDLREGYVFMGLAAIDSVAPTGGRDDKYAYLATTAGTYTNLGGLTVADNEIALLERYADVGDVTRWRKVTCGTYVKVSDIVDSTDSSATNKPLSANMGKSLQLAVNAKYTKPGTGIPATDMASAVQTSLGKADSAYQKPVGGIPSTDMTAAVRTSLGKADAAIPSVPSATDGNIAQFDENGNVEDSGKKASDFATAAQGEKADSAVQPVALSDYAPVENLKDGTLVPKLAENLESWEGNNHPVDNDFDNTIRTTAGDDPIDTDAGGLLLAIKAVSDFKCTGLLATAENQLRLKSNGGGAVAVGTGWYFPVPTLTYGAFGTADENNGLILVAQDGSNIQNATVYFKALANGVPTSVNDGVEATSQTITYNGKTYKVYTTSGPGYLIVSGITYAETCARIAWEDWYDKFVSPTAQDDLGGSLDLTALFTAAPNGTGKFIVCGGSATQAERISASQWRITDPVGRIASPVWTDTPDEVEEGETQTYTHTLTIIDIADNGIAVIEGSAQSLSVDGTTVSYTDTNATAISGAVRYELATPATATVSLNSAYTLNDVGVEMKEGAEGEADFTCQYSQNIADSLALGAPKLNALRSTAAAISLGYGLCTTGTYIKDKVVTIPNFMLLENGIIHVLFTTPINTERSTLNVSLTGAKPLRILGQNLPAGVVKAQTYATLAYDGEAWNIVNLFCPDSSFDPAGLVVDMGLTSGTKWAARDLDLTKPGGFCDTPFVYEKSFFSWGNIDGHNPKNNSFTNVYNWGSVNAQEPWYDGQPYGSTKGNTLAGDIPVGEEFDAARANLGSPWRMPTNADFGELFAGCIFIDATGTEIPSETTDKRVTVNGIVGLYLQSKTNGNRLFFAASGRGGGSSWSYRGSDGLYWSATFRSASNARYLGFGSGGVYPQDYDGRYYGFAVRPVQ